MGIWGYNPTYGSYNPICSISGRGPPCMGTSFPKNNIYIYIGFSLKHRIYLSLCDSRNYALFGWTMYIIWLWLKLIGPPQKNNYIYTNQSDTFLKPFRGTKQIWWTLLSIKIYLTLVPTRWFVSIRNKWSYIMEASQMRGVEASSSPEGILTLRWI